MSSAVASAPKAFAPVANPGGEDARTAGDEELANKLNSLYFEAPTMRALFAVIQEWQIAHRKRLLNLQIQKEGDVLCCIALTNPTEVIITSGGGMGAGYANVSNGALRVETKCVGRAPRAAPLPLRAPPPRAPHGLPPPPSPAHPRTTLAPPPPLGTKLRSRGSASRPVSWELNRCRSVLEKMLQYN